VTLEKLLAPDGCKLADSANEITHELRNIIGALLENNAKKTFPVVIEVRSSSVSADHAEYQAVVKREVLIELDEGEKGRFRTRMKSEAPGGRGSTAILAVLVDDQEPAAVDGVVLALPPDAPLRDDTTRAQLLELFSSGGLKGVVRLSGPPTHRRVEARLKQTLGIYTDAEVVTFEPTAAGEANKGRLVIASPVCTLSFTRSGQEWTLIRIVPNLVQ
jgi:hypothetical protein